jgi:YidC/Oxa1 family membrane protein insertase
MLGFLGVPVGAAYHLVFALTCLLAPVIGGPAATTAIVLSTVAVRLLVCPLSLRALRGQATMARLAPQVQDLSKRFGRQPERFKRELAALYKREGTSPLAGFLPLLAQWPFLSVTYLLFSSATVNGAPNKLLSDGLFGVPLGAHWLSGGGVLGVHGALFLAVFAVLAVLGWLSARLAKRVAATATQAAAQQPGTRVRPGLDAAPANGATMSLLTRLLPYATVVFAAFVPLAAGIYLLTTVAWTLAERGFFLRGGTSGQPRPAVSRPARPRLRGRGRGVPWRSGSAAG